MIIVNRGSGYAYQNAVSDVKRPEEMEAFFTDSGVSYTDNAFLSGLLPNKANLSEYDLECVWGGVTVKDWVYSRLTSR